VRSRPDSGPGVKERDRIVRLVMSAKEIGSIDADETQSQKSSSRQEGDDGRGARSASAVGEENLPAVRRRLPDERHSLTHHFSVGGQEGYVTVGLYEDGLPGEMFIRMAKEGSTVSGLMDSFATAVSLALQYGVPLQVLCNKFSHTRFEPSGWSGNPKIGYAKSIMDYLFRWLELRFLKGEQGILFDLQNPLKARPEARGAVERLGQVVGLGDAPACQFCGALMVRNGSCYRCMECGSTSGCS
jgi:ribonucleoside-diphosphate reductase alpha chain